MVFWGLGSGRRVRAGRGWGGGLFPGVGFLLGIGLLFFDAFWWFIRVVFEIFEEEEVEVEVKRFTVVDVKEWAFVYIRYR